MHPAPMRPIHGILCGALFAAGLVAATPARPAPAPAPERPVLPWIADDWPRAVALAKARKVPIFVENWAPW
jgi:hypothetical protein